ncbi:clostripain-related cysteine peptidase [Bacteroides sp. OttesenSCG-928-D19]|nr:clostripain-related cysteine peptidase [Bacteroides sp. OttesenSCG-928-N06]MDL2304522.1 clostripain-related cysteine peptidase [Bacteroides sp. OttesenSCG-928-D19]
MHKLLISISVLLLFVSCKDNKKEESGEANRTVFAYLIGDNGSSELSSYLLSDFGEMVDGMTGVDDTKNNLIVYCETNRDLPQLIHIRKKKGVVIADTIRTYPEQNPLNIDIMRQVMSDVFDKFPANSYGFILASHGEGWIPATKSANTRWIGMYRNSYLDISDLRLVLEEMPHFDFIFFDACFMQAAEVVYELRNCTDYLISSPAEIPGPGAPYQMAVPAMFANKKDVAVDIAAAYYNYYKNDEGTYFLDGSKRTWSHGVSVSVVKTSELDALASATKKVISKYVDDNLNTSSLFNYGYGISVSPRMYYYDLRDFIKSITEGNADYNEWLSAFNKAQPYFETTATNWSNRTGGRPLDMTNAGGIATCIPINMASFQYQYYKSLDWYSAAGWEQATN